MLEIVQIPVLQDNYLYLIHDPDSGQTAIVDPAVKEPVLDACAQRGWTLTHILNTHHHWDHTGANKALKADTGCKIIGFSGDKDRIPGIDQTVSGGDTIHLGTRSASVIEVPGHTSGHIAYHFGADKALFIGDTVFAMGCGRLFEGSPQQMWTSLQKIIALPADTTLYCAHEYTLSNAQFALTIDPENPILLKRVEEVKAIRAAEKPTVPFSLRAELDTNPFLRPTDKSIRRHLNMEEAEDWQVFAEIRSRKDSF